MKPDDNNKKLLKIEPSLFYFISTLISAYFWHAQVVEGSSNELVFVLPFYIASVDKFCGTFRNPIRVWILENKPTSK